MDSRFEHYSWEQFETGCSKIAVWAKNRGFKNVYGIPRGGLVVAIKLSHLLDIPLSLHIQDITAQTLIVDDIVDTGKAMERATMFFSAGDKVSIASIYSSKHPKIKPDFFIHTKNKWVVFPWETDKTSKYDETPS